MRISKNGRHLTENEYFWYSVLFIILFSLILLNKTHYTTEFSNLFFTYTNVKVVGQCKY